MHVGLMLWCFGGGVGGGDGDGANIGLVLCLEAAPLSTSGQLLRDQIRNGAPLQVRILYTSAQ
jgi:hypothetical protein